MPPKPVIEISAAAVVDLKAQLAQQTEQFEKQRSGAKHGPAAARRSDKKPTVWARQNKGIEGRQQRDQVQHLEQVESHSLARSREALERKARLYEEMRKRVRTSDDEESDEDILIDFDRKYWEDRELEKKRKAADKEKKKKDNQEDDEDDPWVEYVDEFGRTRIVRQSEVPTQQEDDDDLSSEGSSPRLFVPRDPDELATRADIIHYDSTKEVRTRGVGFYQFALDEEERAEQMRRLNELRQETEEARRNARSAADKRKAALQKNAEKIHARRAELLAKKKQKTEEQQHTTNIDENSITQFLKSVRKKVE